MPDQEPDAAKPVLKQYFGASRRHPEACVEMSFPVPDRRFSLLRLASGLREAGHTLDTAQLQGEFLLTDAIVILASMVLGGPAQPRWRSGVDGGTGWVCVPHVVPRIAASALLHCHDAILHDETPEAADVLLRNLSAWQPVGSINGLLMHAAPELGLDITFASRGETVFQIGSGAEGRHFFELGNDRDGLTGWMLARDKLSTVEVLQRVGLPTTRAVPLWRRDDPLEVAGSIGFPCVVKPRDRGKGQGVTARIESAQHLAEAVEHAARVSDYPLVLENHVDGLDHRMLVLDGKLLWVYRRTPPCVIGDGQATVQELIAAENQRRANAGETQAAYLQDIVPDPSLQRFIGEHHGLTLHAVPAAGHRIDLGSEANLARGGTLDDVTAQVHPDNRDMAVRAARLLRLSAAGLDFMTPDISRSWKEVPSAIIEVNTNPGISGRGDASLALRTMFPFRLSGRVPAFVVIGDEDYQRALRRSLFAALARAKVRAGHCTYRRGGKTEPSGEASHSIRAPEVEALLLDPRIEAVVVSSSLAHIEARGFPLGHSDVLFAAGTELPPYVTQAAGQVITRVLDEDGISRLVDKVIGRYRSARRGGVRPSVELVGGTGASDSGGEFVTLRCWRTRALPRARFLAGTEPEDGVEAGGSMIGTEDIVGAVRRLTHREISGTGHAGPDIEFGQIGLAYAWDSPYMDVPVVIAREDHEAALKSLASAVDAVNTLIDRLG